MCGDQVGVEAALLNNSSCWVAVAGKGLPAATHLSVQCSLLSDLLAMDPFGYLRYLDRYSGDGPD